MMASTRKATAVERYRYICAGSRQLPRVAARQARKNRPDRRRSAMIGILKAYLAGDKSVCRVVDALPRGGGRAQSNARARRSRARAHPNYLSDQGATCITGAYDLSKPSRAVTGQNSSTTCAPAMGGLCHQTFVDKLSAVSNGSRCSTIRSRDIERDRAEVVLHEESTFPCREKAVRLEQLKGIGPNSAAMLVAEVFCRKFESRRHVAAFLGLAPAPFASGDVSRDQGISKAGNRSTRADGGTCLVLVEISAK
ncbi:MAG: transposase [Novosphingobium sp.]